MSNDTVPAGAVRALIDEWERRGVEEPYGMTWHPPADELRAILEEHTDE